MNVARIHLEKVETLLYHTYVDTHSCIHCASSYSVSHLVQLRYNHTYIHTYIHIHDDCYQNSADVQL